MVERNTPTIIQRIREWPQECDLPDTRALYIQWQCFVPILQQDERLLRHFQRQRDVVLDQSRRVDVVGDVWIIKKPEVILDAQYTLYPLLKGREGKRTVGDEVDEGLNRG